MKKCKICLQEKAEDSFEPKGKKSSRNECRDCRNASRRTPESRDHINAQNRARRRAHPEFAILQDSRGSDSKKGLDNDLNLAFIRNRIVKGCSYCKRKEGRMTLDRKDNSLGHLKANVVPCCIRCNLIRGDMPYKAWLELVPALKLPKTQKLLGSWGLEPLRKRVFRERKKLPRQNESKGRTMVDVTCLHCGRTTSKIKSYVENNRRRGYAGPFCDRSCSSSWTQARLDSRRRSDG